jgi:predicted RNase H-like nuclease (RuvC/YqgF family)
METAERNGVDGAGRDPIDARIQELTEENRRLSEENRRLSEEVSKLKRELARARSSRPSGSGMSSRLYDALRE